eukprot:Mrub_09392.p2 GENE.Mrub_09392~~Mrub_09392.p2  ORF type:complete len:157 (-),score=53.96 Mrub_09392:100-570(-)
MTGSKYEPKMTRHLMKNVKELEKAGYELCKDFTKVSLRKDRHVITIEKPVIYKHKETNTYFFVGNIKTDDYLTESANLFKKFAPDAKDEAGKDDKKKLEDVKEEDEEEEETEDANIKEDDVNQIMSQAGVDRKQAVKALKENNYDVVETIVNLTGI